MPDAELLVELYKHSKNSAPSLEIDVLQVDFFFVYTYDIPLYINFLAL